MARFNIVEVDPQTNQADPDNIIETTSDLDEARGIAQDLEEDHPEEGSVAVIDTVNNAVYYGPHNTPLVQE